MSTEVVEAMSSKPVYGAVVAGLATGRRLLLTQTIGQAERMGLLEQLAHDGQLLELLCPAADEGVFEARVQSLLADAAVGARLYVCGDESFIWRAHALARQAGLLDEEIELFNTGEQRTLYCVHCATLQVIGDQGQADCAGCGVRLLVREHFSRRLGAYMGVCLDPDHPHAEGQP